MFDKKKNIVVGVHAEEETAEKRAEQKDTYVTFSVIVAK